MKRVRIEETTPALLSQWRRTIHNPDWLFGGEWRTHDEVLAQTMAGRAWPATLQAYRKAEALDLGDMPVYRQSRRHREWDDLHGDAADIGRALVGVAPWEQYKRTASKRSITIGLCPTLSCANSNAEWNANTLTAVRVVDALMAAGYDVRVMIVHGGEVGFDTDNWDVLHYTLKDFGQPFDQEAMIAHGAQGWFRGFILANLSRMENDGDPNCSMSGRAVKFPSALVQRIGVDVLVAKQWEERGSQADYQRKIFDEVKAVTEGVANA